MSPFVRLFVAAGSRHTESVVEDDAKQFCRDLFTARTTRHNLRHLIFAKSSRSPHPAHPGQLTHPAHPGQLTHPAHPGQLTHLTSPVTSTTPTDPPQVVHASPSTPSHPRQSIHPKSSTPTPRMWTCGCSKGTRRAWRKPSNPTALGYGTNSESVTPSHT